VGSVRIKETAVSRLISLAAALALVLVRPDMLLAQQQAPQQPAAQQPGVQQPRVSTVVESADELYRQLDYVMGLTTPEEQKELPQIKEHFDVFLIGVDRKLPGRMDLLIDQHPFRYQLAVPVQNLAAFRQNNLRPLGLDHRQIARTLYHFKNKVWNGYMRLLHNYAIFGELNADVPIQMPHPRQAIQGVLQQGYAASFDLEIQDPAPVNQQQRRANFNHADGIRKVMLGALVQGKTETPNEFAVRKLTVEHQLDELERLYAEASQARVGWRLDTQQGRGRFELAVAPIPGTSLDNMIAALGQRPSRFTNIPRTKDTVLSARINHPLDQLRQDNFRETLQLLSKISKDEIAADTTRTAEQKDAAAQVVDLIYDLLDANLKAGLAEGFAEVQPRGNGRHTGVAAMQSVNGNAAIDILKQLAKTRANRQVQLNMDQQGDVSMHSVEVTEQEHPGYADFFGNNLLYVGTSKDAVWLAAGPEAVATLKTAIGQAAQPGQAGGAADLAIDAYAKLGPFVELMHKRVGMKGDPQRQKWRRLAIEAFQPGDDVLDLRIGRVDANLRGEMIALPGILRYIGKMFADFSKENLKD
jgi:hypothetical protein